MSGNSTPSTPRFWAVIPAAGSGRRMGGDIPKQYLRLAGRTVIEHTLHRLAGHPRIDGLMVAVSAGDEYWQDVDRDLACPLHVTAGGSERHLSVLNALQALSGLADDHDWVLVHDAARPCIRSADITLLIDGLRSHAVGGLLGIPVSDTLKRVDGAGQVRATVTRDGLWRALTPQMFRLGMLRSALQAAVDKGLHVTDDASAVELAGLVPQMLEGHGDNIKITRPRDLRLAELYMTEQEGTV